MPTSGYGGGVSATATPAVAAFSPDGQAGATGGGQVFGSRCLLPRGASLADDGKRLLVVCAGSDELVEISVRSKGLRVHRILRVPKGPSGVAFDPASKQAIVWSAFERVVSTVSFDKEPKVTSRTTVVRRAEAPPDEVLRGRALFHATFDGRVSSDGRACASCHPDGRDDALTWSAPGGARQTPMLFARIAGTAPFGWDGDAKDLAHHLSHTTARLGGSGLTARNVADIEAYLGWLRPPTAPEYDDGRASLVARGREVFNASSAECSTCHAGDPLTDGDTHDVASRGKGDRLKAFDTPSLRFVARSAPYFHDGRYASLDALVAGVDGTMGHTAQLSPDDRAALLAYLETL
jgi:mono/diheme cytochrome c family protein